ncbi:hypothetical protein D3C76_1556520 [compost metagenome]
MSTGKQRDITVLHGQVFHRVDDFAPVRQHHVLTRSRQHQGMRQVVDIFRRTGKVDELRHRVQRRYALYFLFQEVFNRFHIVVGGALNGFDTRRVFFAELRDDFIKVIVCLGVKSRNFLDCCLGS